MLFCQEMTFMRLPERSLSAVEMLLRNLSGQEKAPALEPFNDPCANLQGMLQQLQQWAASCNDSRCYPAAFCPLPAQDVCHHPCLQYRTANHRTMPVPLGSWVVSESEMFPWIRIV